MLKIELGGKVVATTNEKQTIHINGMPVEIERVGNSIYVNNVAINLIVVDKKPIKMHWVIFGFIVAFGAIGYVVTTNQDAVVAAGNAAIDYMQTAVIPTVNGLVDDIISNAEGN